MIAIDIDDAKLKTANLHGADICINSKSSPSLQEEVFDHAHEGVAYTLDAIGNQSVITAAINILKRRGKHIQVGLLSPDKKITPISMDKIIAYELEIKGSHGMQAFRYQEMLELIDQGKLKPQNLISDRIGLEKGVDALQNMDQFESEGVQVITSF